MNLPKKVINTGKTYTVKVDNTRIDSTGCTYSQAIMIGTKLRSDERTFENFLHEVMEIVAVERLHRYSEEDDSDGSIFVMNHNQFYNYVIDVAAAIFPMFKTK